jgi:acetyltransferase-like isoleucine patch superfamily enzyme
MPLLKNIFGSENLTKSKGLPETKFSENYRIQESAVIGVEYKKGSKSPTIGKNPLIRSNTVIYNDVEIADDFKTGHNVVIREKTRIGNDVLVGTNSVIEGNCTIGNNVRIQSNVYIPTNTTIEDNVFIGPCACFTNDKYPVRIDFDLKGPIIKRGASVGANSTFLSDVEIGEGAMVAAGAIVTKDVPSFFLAIGVPARIKPLPKHLKTSNKL